MSMEAGPSANTDTQNKEMLAQSPIPGYIAEVLSLGYFSFAVKNID